jgi:predicted Fe-Mo cluster-binding NifX family protein
MHGGNEMGRIVIPVVDEGGASLSDHFGRAPYFAWYEIEAGNIVDKGIIPNESEHFGGSGNPPDRILQLKPNALITFGMGPRALNIFQNAKVAVLRANAGTVEEVIRAYNNDELEELTEGCHQALHR